tara:strand:- start:3719 stop:4261 length:543 start_codon:yes stop_codon:yes gene_type:complete
VKAPKFYRYCRRAWRDSEHQEIVALGPEVFLVATYLRTCPRGNFSGIYHAPIRSMSKDCCLPVEVVNDAVTALAGIDFCRYDDDAEYVWVRGAAFDELGDNPSPQQISGMYNMITRLVVDEGAPFAMELDHQLRSIPEYAAKLNSSHKKAKPPDQAVIQAQTKFQPQTIDGFMAHKIGKG